MDWPSGGVRKWTHGTLTGRLWTEEKIEIKLKIIVSKIKIKKSYTYLALQSKKKKNLLRVPNNMSYKICIVFA